MPALALCNLGWAGAATHLVRAGDTLWSVARQRGVSVAQVRAANGLRGDLLRVGQVLRLDSLGAVAAPVRLVAASERIIQRGWGVYYGGRRDARTTMTAAHLSLPFGTWVRVTHSRTGRSVTVMINDRGPFGRPGRVIDLSRVAASRLGILGEGVAPVTLSALP